MINIKIINNIVNIIDKKLLGLTNFWYLKKLPFFFWIFYPLEIIYKIIIYVRKKLYFYNFLTIHKFNVPVIVVGNISVGGTGKTPIVIYIANYLHDKGFNPGVIGHGYRAKIKNTPKIVNKNADPYIFGDEALLLANNTSCPVVIGKDRCEAIKWLLKNFIVNVIICDDGLQCYSLNRDLEIAVVDSQRLFGNAHCLPLGPLREQINRLKKVDLILFNNQLDVPEIKDTSNCTKNIKLNTSEYFKFAKQKLQKSSVDSIVQYTINVIPDRIYNLNNLNITTSVAYFKNFPYVHAIAAIGNNERFFNCLNNLGIKTVNHSFPDHYQYSKKDLEFKDNLPIIMTEKDAVKCYRFANHNCWFQTIKVKLVFEEEFQAYLNHFLANKALRDRNE